MGLFDYFIPDPAIECPACDGFLTGWQGKHSGDMCLFVWQQGTVAPIDQKVDAEVKISERALSGMRVEPEFDIYGGECQQCGFKWWDSAWRVRCWTEGEVWTQTEIVPTPLKGELVAEGWVMCKACLSSWKAIGGKGLYLCRSCQKLVQVENSNPPNDS
ncbi:MAG: hypothetical protein AB1757_29875 [Acidobacteriota bacterium]